MLHGGWQVKGQGNCDGFLGHAWVLLWSTKGANKMLLPWKMYEVMKVGAEAPCASNVQAVRCEHARVGFYGFVWVQTSVVGSPSRTEELFRGLCLWCLSNITAWSVSAGQPGCLLANIPVQFPHFPLFSICLCRISTFSTHSANNSRSLKTSTLRLS